VLSQVFDIEFLALTSLKSFGLAATEIDFRRTKINVFPVKVIASTF